MGHSEQANVERIRRDTGGGDEVGRELRINPDTGRIEYVRRT